MSRRRSAEVVPGLVSVIILNFNGGEDTPECLRNVRQLVDPGGGIETIVVDNASTDGSAELIAREFPDVHLVRNSENRGFAGGCNSGVEVATGEFIAFLNNDARPDPRWLVEAVDVLRERADAACVASRVLSWDGTNVDFIGKAGVTFYGFGYKEHFTEPAAGLGGLESGEVLFATGSAAIFRSEVYRSVGGFDDRFFAFFEDVDLGWRLWMLGHRVLYVPTSIAYHRHHGTMRRFGPWREDFLLERNALFSLIKNLEDEHLPKALSGALLLSVTRGFVHNGTTRTDRFDLALGIGSDDTADSLAVDKRAAASAFAIAEVGANLPELLEARAALQAQRVRSDREIFQLVRFPFLPTNEDPAFLSLHEDVRKLLDLDEAFGVRRRVAVVTGDPLGRRLSGPGIRALELARVLSRGHEVRLATTNTIDLEEPGILVQSVADEDQMRDLDQWADVLIFQGFLLLYYPWLTESSTVLVADLYDPFHLEELEQSRHLAHGERTKHLSDTLAVVNHQLQHADFFVCASTKQRDFWLGQLAAMGRINAATYDSDVSLRSLLGVVPFGLPDTPPRHSRPVLRGVVDGIGFDDRVIYWGGGLYPWFDPQLVIRAAAAAKEAIPNLRVVFPAGRHPNPLVAPNKVVEECKQLAAELGVLDQHVFFIDHWIHYEDRHNYLLEADIGISTHFDHLETEFSFRTRILDYIWSGLPILTTAGDSMAELVEREKVGLVVVPDDLAGLTHALERLCKDDDFRAECQERLRVVATRFTWPEVAAPLLEFCRRPHRAPDGIHRTKAFEALPDLEPMPWKDRLRRDLRSGLEHLRTHGPASTARKVVLRLLPPAHH